MRSIVPNKKKHNSDYFKKIDSEVKAYILGYIVADGSIEDSKRKDRPSNLVRLRFCSTTEDDKILKLIQSEIAPDNNMRYYKTNNSNRKQATIFQICDKELTNDLQNLYDIRPRKTYYNDFQFPKIPKNMERHFIRGYIDGNGSIGEKHFSMVCNSPKFAEQIKDKFVEYCPFLKWYIYEERRKQTTYWSLHFSFYGIVKQYIYDYLYKDANYYLERKRNNALNAVLNATSKKVAQCNA